VSQPGAFLVAMAVAGGTSIGLRVCETKQGTALSQSSPRSVKTHMRFDQLLDDAELRALTAQAAEA